jgi:hypothetical protein
LSIERANGGKVDCALNRRGAWDQWHPTSSATAESNHREAIAAMDFFTVPTLTFGVLYCFFVIAHDRRRISPYEVAVLISD